MIEIFSPAKINLTLDVFKKKSDANFHQIETIYHKLHWGDIITIEKHNTFELIGDFDCATQDNLIYKAWQLLESTEDRDRSPKFKVLFETGLGKIPPVKVNVQKIIPSGAGLGGGSSNAAAFVQGYFELFKLGAISETLKLKLAQLGKDIPFFLNQAPCALGTGFGEIITPLPFHFSQTPVYLYTPNFKQSTSQAYAELNQFDTDYTDRFRKNPDLKLCGNTFNAFFEQKKYSSMKNKSVNLCGSGSSFFSFEDLDLPNFKPLKTKLL